MTRHHLIKAIDEYAFNKRMSWHDRNRGLVEEDEYQASIKKLESGLMDAINSYINTVRSESR